VELIAEERGLAAGAVGVGPVLADGGGKVEVGSKRMRYGGKEVVREVTGVKERGVKKSCAKQAGQWGLG